jgi:hypothetical protein
MTTATPPMPKRFNTTGPCDPLKHYMLPALPRLSSVQGLIVDEEYFLLHAPRQSGKTTCVRAAVREINMGDSHYAMYCTLEELREVKNRNEAMSMLGLTLKRALQESRVEALKKIAESNFWEEVSSLPEFTEFPAGIFLGALSAKLDKGLVVFFDEAEGLTDLPLLSFLSQLRAGYVKRDELPFPSSIALIGMRSLRDYKAGIRPDSESLGSASPFNILAEALTLSDFTEAEVRALYSQHTEATGQVFEDEAVKKAWRWSEGQPWLVNALARETIRKFLVWDYSRPVTGELIDKAADILMRRRDTHIDSLLARLHDPRVERFIGPMMTLSSDSELTTEDSKTSEAYDNDLQYCLDLGLLKEDEEIRPANPIYASVFVRYFGRKLYNKLPKELVGNFLVKGKLDITGLLKDFQKFWARTSEIFLEGFHYIEKGPLILLCAYLEKVANGSGVVIPNYFNGAGYADISVAHARLNYPIELKIKQNERLREKSLVQLLGYMDRLLAKEGWLVVFDRDSAKPWGQKITWETKDMPEGRTIHIVGC